MKCYHKVAGDRVAELHNKNNAVNRLHSRVTQWNPHHQETIHRPDHRSGHSCNCVLQGNMPGPKERKVVKQVLKKCSRQMPDTQTVSRVMCIM